MTASPKKSTFTRKGQRSVVPSLEPMGTTPTESRLVGDIVEKRVKKKLTNPRGRPRGSQDKIRKELRAAVLDAANLAGFDVVVMELVDAEMKLIEIEDPELFAKPGLRKIIERRARRVASGEITDYLRYQATHNATAFLSILGKVLPKQIDLNVQLTSRQVLEEMSERRDHLAELRSAVVEAANGVDYHAIEED